jgi:hypothetical protein
MTEENKPDLDTAEGRGQIMAESVIAAGEGIVPLKFKNDDGTTNVEALTQAYVNLERAKLGGEPTPVVPDPTPVAPVAPVVPTEPTTDTIGDILTKKEPDVVLDWTAVRAEISEKGELSAETLGKLNEAGIPTDLVNAAIEGQKMKAQAQMSKASDIVGGVENLKGLLEWARGQFNEAERMTLAQALEGPLAETTLKGLFEAYKAAKPGTLVSTAGDPSAGLAPGATIIKQYANEKEMFADMNDKRYQYDPDWQEHVRLRCAASSSQTIKK